MHNQKRKTENEQSKYLSWKVRKTQQNKPIKVEQ